MWFPAHTILALLLMDVGLQYLCSILIVWAVTKFLNLPELSCDRCASPISSSIMQSFPSEVPSWNLSLKNWLIEIGIFALPSISGITQSVRIDLPDPALPMIKNASWASLVGSRRYPNICFSVHTSSSSNNSSRHILKFGNSGSLQFGTFTKS